jgi:hypothetical protein
MPSTMTVGVGRLPRDEYADLLAFFCDGEGEAGLVSTFLAETQQANDTTSIEDEDVVALGSRWRAVRTRLARMPPLERRTLEVAFRWLAVTPLERRRRLHRAFGGVAGLVEAHLGAEGAEAIARKWEHARRFGHTLPPGAALALQRAAHTVRVNMQARMERAERAWLRAA